MATKQWEQYEEAARALLEQAAELLNLKRIEGKQQIEGTSGYKWEIDVVAYQSQNEKVIIVECKHWRDTRIDPETVGGFANRIEDINAQKGLLITTVGLSKGAKMVADANKIEELSLREGSTKEEYIGQIRDHIFVKLTAGIGINIKTDSQSIDVKEVKPHAIANIKINISTRIEKQEE